MKNDSEVIRQKNFDYGPDKITLIFHDILLFMSTIHNKFLVDGTFSLILYKHFFMLLSCIVIIYLDLNHIDGDNMWVTFPQKLKHLNMCGLINTYTRT